LRYCGVLGRLLLLLRWLLHWLLHWLLWQLLLLLLLLLLLTVHPSWISSCDLRRILHDIIHLLLMRQSAGILVGFVCDSRLHGESRWTIERHGKLLQLR
jgi:hypothetical protein